MKPSRRLRRWLGLGRAWDLWDRGLALAERSARAAREKIVGWLAAAHRRIPRCLARQRVPLAVEGLETRFMPTTVGFTASLYNTNEKAGSVSIAVALNAATPLPVSVHYSTADLSAQAGRDYTTASGTLNFAPFQVTLCPFR